MGFVWEMLALRKKSGWVLESIGFGAAVVEPTIVTTPEESRGPEIVRPLA
jgi:hypothetical protein